MLHTDLQVTCMQPANADCINNCDRINLAIESE